MPNSRNLNAKVPAFCYMKFSSNVFSSNSTNGLSRILSLALCPELGAVTASRQYCVVFISYQYDDESLSSRPLLRGSVSTASLRHIYESSVSQWTMSVVAHDCGQHQLAAFYDTIRYDTVD